MTSGRATSARTAEAFLSFGAGGRIRTDGLLITNQLLYQLSYASETGCACVRRPGYPAILQSSTMAAQ
ncbi:hypothetical protein THIOKS11840037 [Thiocapsa sp. KS1]|nr:hypothetical protein THIOKS11840037 [Thiocapsa sp. KS1]